MNQRRFCRFLGVSRKSYYRVIQDEPSPDDEHEHEHELKPELRRNSDSDGDERQVLNEQERRRIQELAKEHELYGHRKICVLADREGIETSFSTVYRELKRVGLNLPRDYARQAKRRAKRKREKEEITEINQEWQTDLVEFKIGEFGTHYFIGVEDIFSRYVLAWILSPTQPAEVVVEVLERAWEKRSGLCGEGELRRPIVVRTDNGGQFRSKVWQSYLEDPEEKRFDHERTAYRSPKEIGYIESFHSKLKVEEIYQQAYEDPLEAMGSIARWIEAYNTFRPHQGLGYRTPEEVYLEGVEALELKNGQSANQNHGVSVSKK